MTAQKQLPADLQQQLSSCVDALFESEQVPFLESLVNRASHTYAKDDVENAASFLDLAAENLEMHVERFSDPDGRFADHRIYRSKNTGPTSASIGLIGHIDTVFPRELGFLTFSRGPFDFDFDGPQFGVENDADIIHGPGVLDMKSGLSAILFALRAVREVSQDLFDELRVRFICVSDEEVGSPSSKPLFKDVSPYLTKALVFEAGRDQDRIVTQRKGSGGFRVTAHGRAAHAGNRHREGINAIHALSLLIPAIEGLTDYDAGVTVNVGLIQGGTAKNTVPETAHCTIDCRFETKEDGEALEEKLKSMCLEPFPNGTIPTKLNNVTFTLSGGISRPPMEKSPSSTQLREDYEHYAQLAGLKAGEAPLQGGGSDANLLSAFGVPSIDGLGPFGKHFHKVEEWSSLSSLRRRTLALAWYLAAHATRAQIDDKY